MRYNWCLLYTVAVIYWPHRSFISCSAFWENGSWDSLIHIGSMEWHFWTQSSSRESLAMFYLLQWVSLILYHYCMVYPFKCTQPTFNPFNPPHYFLTFWTQILHFVGIKVKCRVNPVHLFSSMNRMHVIPEIVSLSSSLNLCNHLLKKN